MSVLDKHLNGNFSTFRETYESVFEQFDRNSDGFLDEGEFKELLQELFQSSGKSDANLTPAVVSNFLQALDLDKDGKLGMEDFQCAWKYWLKQVLKPVTALIIVDVQNDFICGSLSLTACPAKQDGAEVIPVINSLLEAKLFDVVVYTYDWHPETHISFVDNVHLRSCHHESKVKPKDAKVYETVTFDVDNCKREQSMWPRHCVQKSWGSELHPNLKVVENAFHVNKGTNADVDSYSAFWDNDKLSRTELSSILKEQRVTDVYVCGVAYDVCVGFTATHAVEHGFRTILIEDACRGVTFDGMSKMKCDLSAKGVHVANAADVPKLIKSEVRPVSLVSQAIVNYKTAWEIVRGKQKASS